MKTCISLFRIRFLTGIQYRAAAAAAMFTNFFWGIMLISLYRAFYQSSPEAFPMSFSQLVSYTWLQQAFLSLLSTWIWDKSVFSAISDGSVAYELVRPVDLYGMWFAKSLALRVSAAALRFWPILLIASLLPQPYRFPLPVGPLAALLFLVTLVLGAMMAVAFCMLVYISAFYTLDSGGMRAVVTSVGGLLAGELVPIPFLPDKLAALVELTPFAAMQNLPLRIYGGHIAGAEMLRGILLQLFWLLLLIVVGRLWLSRTLRRVIVQGG